MIINTVFNLKTINFVSPPQKDPNNPYYQLDLKCSGVNSGTFGSIGTVPMIRINTKGLVTLAGATTGIVIPPFITDFTIKGQNSSSNPLYTNLENYNPNQDEVENISGFIGNYGKSLYSSNSLMYDKASGSISIGVKSNSTNAVNENNVAIGQRAMEDAYSARTVAIGSYTASKTLLNNNTICVGYGAPVVGGNTPINSDNIVIGSGLFNSSGTKSIFINNNKVLQIAGNATSNSISIGGFPHFGLEPDYSGILIGQTFGFEGLNITLQQSILIGNPYTAVNQTFKESLSYKTSVAIIQSGTQSYNALRSIGLESSVLISNEAPPPKYYRDQIDGAGHVILGNGAGIVKPSIVSTDNPTDCIAIGMYSTGSSKGISIGHKSGSFIAPQNGTLPGVGTLGGAFTGGVGASFFGAGPPDGKTYPYGIMGKIVPDNEYVSGDAVTILAGGQTHSAALINQGRMYVCGLNNAGQLGLGDNTPRYTYTLVPWSNSFTFGIKITQICAYYNGTFVILNDGRLYGSGQINPTSTTSSFTLIDSGPWTVISAARDYVTGKTTWAGIKGGKLFTMGDNTYGQLGNGTTGGSTSTFAMVGSSTYTKVECGKSFILAVRSDNRSLAWGKNDVGQLGLGNTNNYNTPQTVPLFIKAILGGTPEYDTSNIVSISAGFECALAVTANGNAFMTGRISTYFSSLSYKKLEISTPTANPPFFVLPTQCLVINDSDIYFKMNNGTVYAIGRGDGGTFFAGDNPNNTFTGIAQALNPARFTELTVLGATNTLVKGFTPGAHVLMPTLGGAGANYNRICLAADGLVIPNFLIIGGAGGKLLGSPDGTGVESIAYSGAAAALPNTPSAYLSTAINGTKYKLPLYNI
jgi:alpha-tubulin suppressor-like RCC1 family protein